MSVITTLILKNKANADVTFVRESGNGSTVTLRDSSEPIWVRAARVVMRNVLPAKNGAVVRHQKELDQPIYDANGVLLRTLRYKSEFLLPTSSTDTERDEFLARVKSLESSVTTEENVADLNLAS